MSLKLSHDIPGAVSLHDMAISCVSRFDVHHHPHVHRGVGSGPDPGSPRVHQRGDDRRGTVCGQRGGRHLQLGQGRLEVSAPYHTPQLSLSSLHNHTQNLAVQ